MATINFIYCDNFVMIPKFFTYVIATGDIEV